LFALVYHIVHIKNHRSLKEQLQI